MVDESTGASVVSYLRNAGHDVLSVVETIPSANDLQILEEAVDTDRILITNDKDFGDLVFRSQRVHAGIILLRLKQDTGVARVATIRNLLEQYGNRLMRKLHRCFRGQCSHTPDPSVAPLMCNAYEMPVPLPNGAHCAALAAGRIGGAECRRSN